MPIYLAKLRCMYHKQKLFALFFCCASSFPKKKPDKHPCSSPFVFVQLLALVVSVWWFSAILLAFFAPCNTATAQNSKVAPSAAVATAADTIYLQLKGDPDSRCLFQKALPFFPFFIGTDSLLHAQLQQSITTLRDSGYPAASIDSLLKNATTDTTTIYIYVGAAAQWQQWHSDSTAAYWLQRSKISLPVCSEHRPCLATDWLQLRHRLLQYLENNGYPFAQVQLQVAATAPVASIRVVPHERISIDSIALKGNVRLRQRFIQQYFGIARGDLYSEAALQRIEKRQRQLPFLTATQKPQVRFVGEEAIIHLFAKSTNANRFSAMLGLQAQSQGKYAILGEADLQLYNTLGQGEQFAFWYRALNKEMSEIKSKVAFLYLPYLPFGAALHFDVFLNRLQFREVRWYSALQYSPLAFIDVQFFVEKKTSDLLQIDTLALLAQKQLPSQLDVKRTLYGATVQYRTLNDDIAPTKGYALSCKGGIGQRIIRKNNSITSLRLPTDTAFSFSALYDALSLKSTQWTIEASAQYYWNIKNKSVVKTAIFAAFLNNIAAAASSKNDTYRNEWFRIGGIHALRGFDEQSISTPYYVLPVLEYRYMLQGRSFFFAFTEGARIAAATTTSPNAATHLLAVGGGIQVATQGGVLSLTYASGMREDENFKVSLQRAKVHVAYINWF